jgi:hypothetical protein
LSPELAESVASDELMTRIRYLLLIIERKRA